MHPTSPRKRLSHSQKCLLGDALKDFLWTLDGKKRESFGLEIQHIQELRSKPEISSRDLSFGRGQGRGRAQILDRKRVAIQTLTESAAERAKKILEDICPTCSVTVNTDGHGTERLESLAKNSDIFVCVWKSNKHAATKYIEKFRKKEDIVLPLGKGSSSIISAISSHYSV